MKRLMILLLLLFCATAYAEDVQIARLSPALVGGGVPAAGDSALYTAAIAVYDFESGSGTADTKGTYTLTANGGATISTANTPPVGTYTGIGDGVGDYWSLADNSAFDFTGDYSVSFWIRLASHEAGYSVVQKYVDGDGWQIYVTYVTDAFKFQFRNSSGWTQPIASFAAYTVELETWLHVVFIYDGTHITLYVSTSSFGDKVNGTQIDYTQDPAGSAASLWIANGSGAGEGEMNGQIDEVVFWNSAITLANAQALFAKNWR